MPVVSREMIETRAYEIWVEEGRPHGRHDEHWARAAEELGAGAAAPGETKAKTGAKAAKPKAVKAAATAAPVAEKTAPAAKPKRTTKAR